MKYFFNERIKRAQEASLNGFGNEDYNETVAAYNFLTSNKTNFMDEKMSAIDMTVSEEFFVFMQRLFDICSETPLLETESSLEFPDLLTSKRRSDSDIRKFVNTVYGQEVKSDETYVDDSNFQIFHANFAKRIRFGHGTIAVYRDFTFNKRIMVLERFNTIRDLIYPASYAAELLDRPMNEVYSNKVNVMKNFMKMRATDYIYDPDGEVLKHKRITFDNIVYGARKYSKALNSMTCEEFNHLPVRARTNILDITDRIIGYVLASDPDIKLRTLINSDIMNGSEANLESIGSSLNSIERGLRDASDELKLHSYTLR